MSKKENIEDIYPLSDNQTTFLLNHLKSARDDSGQLVVRCLFAGKLDKQRFIDSWMAIVGKHSAMRTTIHWQKSDKPLQVVRKTIDVDIQFQQYDQAGSNDDVLNNTEQILEHPLKLDISPNHRIIVYSKANNMHIVHWLCHHAFIDGWSASIVLNDFVSVYNGGSINGDENTAGYTQPQFKDFLNWINAQDLTTSCEAWLQRIADKCPNQITHTRVGGQATANRIDTGISMDAGSVADLNQLCKLHKVTPGIIIQTAWNVLLSSLSGSQQISYTLTLSGRSVPLPYIENIVGQLSTALPIFTQLHPEDRFIDLANQIKQENNLLRNYEYLSLSQLTKWGYKPTTSEIILEQGKARLNSLVVIENFDASHRDGIDQDLSLISFQSDVVSLYPVTLIVLTSDDVIKLHLMSNHRQIDATINSFIANALRTILLFAIDNPSAPIGQILESQVKLNPDLDSGPQEFTSSNTNKTRNYCAAKTETQAHLQKIWQDILQTDQRISIVDNFFDIGGTSLKALSMYARLETRFGCVLPLASLLEAPTISQLADLIQDPTDYQAEYIVKIHDSGNQIPIFGIHAQDVLFYRDISAAMGDDQPFYAIQQLDQIDQRTQPHSLRNMAATYIDEIKKIQPGGPYNIIGLCMGCTIGYEIAYQLSKSGERIHALIMIDPDKPGIVFSKRKLSLARIVTSLDLKAWNRLLRFSMDELAKFPIANQLAIAKGKLRIARKSLSGPLEKRRAQRRLHNWMLNQKYNIPDYDGKITVIQSGEYQKSISHFSYNAFEETQHNQLIDNHVIQGSHTSIFSPPTVYETASVIQNAINK